MQEAKSIQLNSAIKIRLMCNVYTVIHKCVCIIFFYQNKVDNHG